MNRLEHFVLCLPEYILVALLLPLMYPIFLIVGIGYLFSKDHSKSLIEYVLEELDS